MCDVVIEESYDLTADGPLAKLFKEKAEKETGKKVEEVVLSFSARYQELRVAIILEEERT